MANKEVKSKNRKSEGCKTARGGMVGRTICEIKGRKKKVNKASDY